MVACINFLLVISFGNLRKGGTAKSFPTTAPILAMPDWTKPFTLLTQMPVKQVLVQFCLSVTKIRSTEHVVAYAGHLLTKPERNYCVTCKELLAVVTFLNHFRHYLIGVRFTICTDYGALTWLRNFRSPEGQLARWLEKLQEYQFTIIHWPGRKHINADCPLSYAMSTVWQK